MKSFVRLTWCVWNHYFLVFEWISCHGLIQNVNVKAKLTISIKPTDLAEQEPISKYVFSKLASWKGHCEFIDILHVYTKLQKQI